MNFRRYYQKDQIVFITQVVQNRYPAFNNPDIVSLLRQSWRRTKDRHPFNMLAYVVLPDHFHFLIQPKGNSNFSQVMHALKLSFTLSYKHQTKTTKPLKFWQKRFWDHVIRSESDLENHIHYIHFNPIKHGYVTDLNQWAFSSFYEWQKRGVYPSMNSWEEPINGKWGE
ncbi:transposase [bacterium]|nr:transposase [bacterium]